MQASGTALLPGAKTDPTGAPVMLGHFSSCFTSQQPCSALEERPAWLVSRNSSVSRSLPSIPPGLCYREKVRDTSQSPCCWKSHLFCLPVAAQPMAATRFWGLGLLQLELLIC